MAHYNELMADYAAQHTKKFNQFTHLIGVPLLLLAVQIFLSLFTLNGFSYSFNLAWLFFLGLCVYYVMLNPRLAISTIGLLFAITLIALLITHHQTSGASLKVFLLVFLVGWGLQMLGHFIEGKKPAFFKNYLQLLIAPLFLMQTLKTTLRQP